MIHKHPVVSVKTMTDYHLESFIQCPYKFYYQYILSLHSNQVQWRQAVQSIMNRIVRSFYQLPASKQNKWSVLKLIDKYWKDMSPYLFESKVHYYLALAKTTDHLLQFLTIKQEQDPPLFLYEKLKAYIEELETQLSLTIEVAEWSTDAFTIKKFLVEADEEMIQLYQYLIAVFSNEAFGKLPETIEIMTLLEGKRYTLLPNRSHVKQGMMYLKMIKDLLKHPTDYSKINSLTECRDCPFISKCKENEKSFNETNRLNEIYLH